jgi:hypothetical protein
MQPLRFQLSLFIAGGVFLALLVGCAAPAADPPANLPADTQIPLTSIPSALPATSTPTPVPPTPLSPTVTPLLNPTVTPVIVTSVEEILGLWLGVENRDGHYQQFNADGTLLTSMIRDLIETKPNVVSDYYFEADKLYLTALEVHGLVECPPGPAIYQVEKYANGNINLIEIKDSCSRRANTMAQMHEPVR